MSSKINFNVKKREKKPVIRTPNEIKQELHRLFFKIAKSSEYPVYERIARNLLRSRSKLRPVSLKELQEEMESYIESSPNFVALVHGKLLGDTRLVGYPAMTVVAYDFSKSALDTIASSGGRAYYIDRLFEVCQNPLRLVEVSGRATARKQEKYWGPAPGVRGSTTLPKTGGFCGKNMEQPLYKKKDPLAFLK